MSSEGLYIDHVIYGVVDIDAAAAYLREEHGLGAVPGALHHGGTTNMFVPLRPPLFLELLGVGDTTLADGAWLEQTLGGRDRPLWWALAVDDLDETASRRGLQVQGGEGATPCRSSGDTMPTLRRAWRCGSGGPRRRRTTARRAASRSWRWASRPRCSRRGAATTTCRCATSGGPWGSAGWA